MFGFLEFGLRDTVVNYTGANTDISGMVPYL